MRYVCKKWYYIPQYSTTTRHPARHTPPVTPQGFCAGYRAALMNDVISRTTTLRDDEIKGLSIFKSIKAVARGYLNSTKVVKKAPFQFALFMIVFNRKFPAAFLRADAIYIILMRIFDYDQQNTYYCRKLENAQHLSRGTGPRKSVDPSR